MPQKRVLVIDDHPGLSAWLHGWGYETEASDSAGTSRDSAVIRRPDAVVIGLGVARRALDVIRRVRAEDPQIVIIAFSDRADLEAQARAAGADAFVLKPNFDLLATSLDDLTRRPSAGSRVPR
jgi:two-component system, sensor histidine kinase